MSEDPSALFGRVCDAKGVLLQVAERRAGANAAELSLTFDVGRVSVKADPATRRIVVSVLDGDGIPRGLQDAAEEDPWWRVLGAPLAAVDASGAGESLRLQFRELSENPRFITLEVQGAALRVGCQGPT